MVSWFAVHPIRFILVLAGYFAMHVLVRAMVSPALDYDESEQSFLSQFVLLGYNSQPPLYTWIQRALFEALGYSVMSMALLKNLFVWLTYVLVFDLVRKATGQIVLGMVAAIGMLTIPQVAWESHRDLSHTVATMFSTSLLIHCLVSMAGVPEKTVPTRMYCLLGFVVGLGALFKYNFVVVVFAMIIATLTIPRYRRVFLDLRLAIAVGITVAMLIPHVLWMVPNLDTATGKTVQSLTTGQTDDWLSNVGMGFSSLGGAILACSVGPILMFGGAFARDSFRIPKVGAGNRLRNDTLQLLTRFLLVVLLVLVCMVLSGRAVDFENRWFQPFIFILPALLTLVFYRQILDSRRFQRNASIAGGLIMIAVLVAIVLRTVAAPYRGRYSRMNIPYAAAAETMRRKGGEVPQIIVTDDIRDAGNLRMQFPNATVVCWEMPHLIPEEIRESLNDGARFWAFCTEKNDEKESELPSRIFEPVTDSKEIYEHLASSGQYWTLPYLYGGGNDRKAFWFAEINAAHVRLKIRRLATRNSIIGSSGQSTR